MSDNADVPAIDDRLHPSRPIVGVGAVIWKDQQVLLVKRANEPLKGKWSLPGGAQHLGETVEEAAKREIMEECGIEVRITSLVDVIDAIFRESDDLIRHHFTIIDVMGEWQAGDLRAASDACDAMWVPLERLEDFALTQKTLAVISKSKGLR